MCGIAGYVSFLDATSEQGVLETMLKSISHRGPDFQKTKSYENVGLAHARLKILDFSTSANQPMESTDGLHALIFNGEIYNHLELRKNINFTGYHTHCDTETLLQGLIQYGKAFLEKLNGIFSFAYLDRTKHELLIVRDRFGVKPLYYTTTPSGFYFASEIRALLQAPNLTLEVDSIAIGEYKTLLSAQEGRTVYKNIKKLLPASYIVIDTQTHIKTEVPFWNIPQKRDYHKDTSQKIIDTTEELLVNAVKRQLLSDAPLGFFLSGGLDSSLLVAIAQKHNMLKEINCYTIQQDTSKFGFENDAPYAEKVADHLGVKLTRVEKPALTIDAIDQILDIIEEPVPDLSAINVAAIAQVAQKQNIKVLLSGLGADDIFTGYRRHLVSAYHQYLKYIPLKILTSLTHNSRIDKIRKAWSPDQERFLINLHNYSINSNETSYTGQMWSKYLQSFPPETAFIDKALALEQINYLPNQNLLYTDKASMHYGVEVRMPYLDHELVDYVYNIPARLKLKGFRTKYILREVAKSYLPKEIIDRKKVGFSQPIDSKLSEVLISKLLKDLAQDSLQELSHNPQYLLNLYAVQRVINTFSNPVK